jgi:hypothetical protein
VATAVNNRQTGARTLAGRLNESIAAQVLLETMNHHTTTYTILHRTNTNEYLSHFEIWDRNSTQWSADLNDAFLFRTHSDAEINGRMVLEWLGDPLNRHVGLSCAKMEIREDKLIVGHWYSVNVTRVA